MNPDIHPTTDLKYGAARSELGSALLLALMILAVLVLLGGAFLSSSLSERSIAVNQTNAGKSFNVAEAGIEHTRALLPTTDIDALLTAGGTMFSNQALDQGSYTVNVSNNIAPDFPRGVVSIDPGGANDDSDNYVVLESTGYFRAAERTIDVVLEREFGQFPYGIYGRDLLRFTGNGMAYMDVGTNGNVEFVGAPPAVDGNADASGTVTDPSQVTGTSTNGTDPTTFDVIPCPAGPFGGVPAGPGVIFNAGNGDISMVGGADKTFAGGTYYYRDFRKAGNSHMIVPLGQSVTIYVSRELDVVGGGFANLNGSAGFLQIFGCGSDSTDWSLAGNDEVWLTLYAPNHNLHLTGNGDKHGSFVGKDVVTSGNANYYFDLGLELPTGRYVLVPGTWSDSGL